MELVPTVKAFNEHLKQAKTVLGNMAVFPKHCVFSILPASHAFFDAAYLTSSELFDTVTYLCEANDDPGFVFMMTDPDPINYFYHHFGWLPAAQFSRSDQPSSFTHFVLRDPGSSPADAIAYRGDEMIIISDSLSFAVYGRRYSEIAVLAGFRKPIDFERDKRLKLIFMDSNMAYDHLSRFKQFPISRDEFVDSWKCQ